jgi:hypothetical protein
MNEADVSLRMAELEAHLRFHQRRLRMDCGTRDVPCPETCLTCMALNENPNRRLASPNATESGRQP